MDRVDLTNAGVVERRAELVRDGVRLVWRVREAIEPKGRPPIVFLHGLASNMTRWSEFVRETSLAREHDLIRVDLRGHGESMTRSGFTLETWVDDLLALLDAERRRPAILVGHSMGATVALATACRAPERITGLVLIDPVFREAVLPEKRHYVRHGPLFAAAARAIRLLNRLGLRRRSLAPLDLEALDREARVALAHPDPAALEAFVARYSSAREDLRHIPHANYLQDMVEMFRPLPHFGVITAPVLALRSTIAGYQDEAIVARRLAEFRRLEVQAIDCHHWPVTERPREVREAVEQWCARVIEAGLRP